jgi:hypothetical protein
MTSYEPTASMIVTVAVFEDEDSWELRVIHESVNPWAVEGLLREAFLRVREMNQAVRALGDEDGGDEDD